MLPSHKRLSRQQIKAFLANPATKVVFNRMGTLKYTISSNNEDFIGFSVITGSKNQKKAVLRNKIRRQLYSLMSQYKDLTFTGMIYVSKHVYEMTFSEIKQHFYNLLQKIAHENKPNS